MGFFLNRSVFRFSRVVILRKKRMFWRIRSEILFLSISGSLKVYFRVVSIWGVTVLGRDFSFFIDWYIVKGFFVFLGVVGLDLVFFWCFCIFFWL